jgi:hypothetical protein
MPGNKGGGAKPGSTHADMREKARAGSLVKADKGTGALRKPLKLGHKDMMTGVDKGALPGPWANRRDPHIPKSLVRT